MIATFSALVRDLGVPSRVGSFFVFQLAENSPYYAGRDSSGAAALLIRTAGPGRNVPLRLAGIEARFNVLCHIATPGGPERDESLTAILCLANDAIIENYFSHAIDLIITILGPTPTSAGVAQSINELVGLFQKLRQPSRKSVAGLIGELMIISCARDARIAVAAWRSDPLERYDFAVGNLRIESKASAVRSRSHQLSLEQADPPPDTIGLLASIFIEPSSGGMSLRELLNQMEVRVDDHMAIQRLRIVVADTLGQDFPKAMSWCFDFSLAKSSLSWFDLRSVPAIRQPVPSGVSGVRFTTDLSTSTPLALGVIRGLDKSAFGLLPL